MTKRQPVLRCECVCEQVSRRWIRFLPFWCRNDVRSKVVFVPAARPLGRAASPVLPAPVSDPRLPAANVWGGLLLPVQQLRSFLLPDAQLHERAASRVGPTVGAFQCSRITGTDLHPSVLQKKKKNSCHLQLISLCVAHRKQAFHYVTLCDAVSITERLWCDKTEGAVSAHCGLEMNWRSTQRLSIHVVFPWGDLSVDSTKVKCWNLACEIARNKKKKKKNL